MRFYYDGKLCFSHAWSTCRTVDQVPAVRPAVHDGDDPGLRSRLERDHQQHPEEHHARDRLGPSLEVTVRRAQAGGRDPSGEGAQIAAHHDGGGAVAVVALRRAISAKPAGVEAMAPALFSRTSSSRRSASSVAGELDHGLEQLRREAGAAVARGRRRSAAARRCRRRCWRRRSRRPRGRPPRPGSGPSAAARARPARPGPSDQASAPRRAASSARDGGDVAVVGRADHETRLGRRARRRRAGAGRAARGRAARRAPRRRSGRASRQLGRAGPRRGREVRRGRARRPPPPTAASVASAAGLSTTGPSSRRPVLVVRREVDLLAARVGGDHEVAASRRRCRRPRRRARRASRRRRRGSRARRRACAR